jgi:hypothetical protein
VILEVEVADEPLEREAVLLAMLLDDLRMRLTRDDVEHVGVAGDDGRHRGNRHLDALAGRDQPEGGEHAAAPVRVTVSLPYAGAAGGQELGGSAVRHDADAFRSHEPGVEDHPAGGLGEDAHEGGLSAQRAQGLGLPDRRGRQDGVQRQDHGLLELTGQGQDVRAVRTPEDPVFVLDHDDVVIAPVEHPGGRGVVAPLILQDLRHHLVRLLGTLLADDRRDVHRGNAVGGQQRVTEVAREGPDPAGSRRVGGDDGNPHGPASLGPDQHAGGSPDLATGLLAPRRWRAPHQAGSAGRARRPELGARRRYERGGSRRATAAPARRATTPRRGPQASPAPT